MKRISTKIFAAIVNVFDNTSCTPKRNLKSEGYSSLFGDVLGMNATKILGLVSIIGAVVGAIGCCLPWFCETSSSSYVFLYPGPRVLVGINFELGKFAFLGCIVAFFSQLVLVLRKKDYMVFVTLTGGFVAFSCSDAWIPNPIIYVAGFTNFEILYGIYVTLIGTGMILVGTILSLYSLAENAASLTTKNATSDQIQQVGNQEHLT